MTTQAQEGCANSVGPGRQVDLRQTVVVARNRPCRYGELRGFSRLGPLGRLVIKAVEAALYVVLLDKVGVRALVDIEG